VLGIDQADSLIVFHPADSAISVQILTVCKMVG
jgi:hypothetical protein